MKDKPWICEICAEEFENEVEIEARFIKVYQKDWREEVAEYYE